MAYKQLVTLISLQLSALCKKITLNFNTCLQNYNKFKSIKTKSLHTKFQLLNYYK